MMAPNINFSPVRVTFCCLLPFITAMMIPANRAIPNINRQKTPTPNRWLCMPSMLRSIRGSGPPSARTSIQSLPLDLRNLLHVLVDEEAVKDRSQEGDADGHQDRQRTVI